MISNRWKSALVAGGLLVGLGAVAMPSVAEANTFLGVDLGPISIGIGPNTPYVVPPPVYAAPAPSYVTPPTSYAVPSQTYVSPPVVYPDGTRVYAETTYPSY
jgi:hypothetical protein